jgi:hypothetical protein
VVGAVRVGRETRARKNKGDGHGQDEESSGVSTAVGSPEIGACLTRAGM